MKVALFLRGHIRDGLFTKDLAKHISHLRSLPRVDLNIFMSTWNVAEAACSYRDLNEHAQECHVDRGLLCHYLSDHVDIIRDITIHNDKKIKLVGKTDGTVAGSKIPRVAWKRMWYGIHHGLEKIDDSYERVINTRFDYFTRPICRANIRVCLKMFHDRGLQFRHPRHSGSTIGVDNYYCGSLKDMKHLSSLFHNNLDDITTKYPDTIYQEELVYKVAKDEGLL